jgi:hypothetical protein
VGKVRTGKEGEEKHGTGIQRVKRVRKTKRERGRIDHVDAEALVVL